MYSESTQSQNLLEEVTAWLRKTYLSLKLWNAQSVTVLVPLVMDPSLWGQNATDVEEKAS
jgi:hypothetical protein